MTPQDIDRRVCEIVGIPGKWNDFPPVSKSLAECEPVLEWLRDKGFLRIGITDTGWNVVFKGNEIDRVGGKTLPAALCAAVLAIGEQKGSQ